ncbi:MAG: Ig-like domain-containing protein [Bacteroidia bacterium]
MHIPFNYKFITVNRFRLYGQNVFFTLLLFLVSCANRVIPSGGIKDIIPPEIVSSAPENYSINFDKKEIRVEFNESIQLEELNKQLIISPLIDPLPEVTTNKRTLKIRFENPLKENTTYTFNFGSAIADVHEKNIMENFLLVFSTGDYLDSLSVSGNITYAENLKTEKGIMVMLYKEHDDSVPYKKIPDYFSRTDSTGNYKISNISSGLFKIFALKDKNSNYLFDQPGEAIAFSDSLIAMSDSAQENLKLFVNPPGKIHLTNAAVEAPGKLRIIFNTRADSVSLEPLSFSKNPWQMEEYSLNRDTLMLWMNDTTIDSLRIALLQNEQPFDTALFVLKRKSSGRGSQAKAFSFMSGATGGILDAGKDLLLQFNTPVETIDESKIIFKTDSVITTGVIYSFTDSVKRNLLVNYKWKENSNYELTFLPGAFKDMFTIENDTAKISFHLKPATEYGTVLLKLKTDDKSPQYIIQLVNDKDEVIREKSITSSAVVNFDFLNPGSYRFKIISDENKNNRWDTGNYLKKIQPEKVVYYMERITIRANWDLEQEWDLNR